jgi:hypothetical protein
VRLSISTVQPWKATPEKLLSAKSKTYREGTMKVFRTLAIALLTLLAWSGFASSQQPASSAKWENLKNKPTFAPDTALQLTDGTVIVHEYETANWWRLTPDNTGSYVDGTWSEIAPMPSDYGPLYFGSAVLADGNVIVEGGEYNFGEGAETNLGAYYNSSTNTWTAVAAPAGWGSIGDSQSVVLPNGTFMLGNCGSCDVATEKEQALLDEATLTWTITGTGKADQNSEEGWTLLPSGDVLTVDMDNGTESEVYNPSTGSWSLAGSTVVSIVNKPCYEIGPAVLQPGGTVFATGADANTALYDTATGTWSAGPEMPNGDGIVDGPAAPLPDGNVLISVAPISPCYANGAVFYEYNGTTYTAEPGPTEASELPTYVGRLLVLPTGQILYTQAVGSKVAEIYQPVGTYQAAWQPTVTSVAATLTAGSTDNLIQGTQFNGLTQGAMYGDDAQMATNYPLVRIVNAASKNVVYCRTHNHSTMGVATGATVVSTEFDIPSTIETGASELFVVANGIPSKPVKVEIQQ